MTVQENHVARRTLCEKVATGLIHGKSVADMAIEFDKEPIAIEIAVASLKNGWTISPEYQKLISTRLAVCYALYNNTHSWKHVANRLATTTRRAQFLYSCYIRSTGSDDQSKKAVEPIAEPIATTSVPSKKLFTRSFVPLPVDKPGAIAAAVKKPYVPTKERRELLIGRLLGLCSRFPVGNFSVDDNRTNEVLAYRRILAFSLREMLYLVQALPHHYIDVVIREPKKEKRHDR